MKQLGLPLVLIFFSFMLSQAQDAGTTNTGKTTFKRGYIRLGINQLGAKLDPNMTPLANVTTGKWGAGMGYTLEFGHIFYFLSRAEPRLFNVGLDWTFLNLNYTKLEKWADYAHQRNEKALLEGNTISASASSRLGPVVAINPIDKLVVEARFQVTYGIHYNYTDYTVNPGEDNQSFLFIESDGDYMYSKGMGTSLGATVRYKFIGIAIDYANAKIPTAYYLRETGQQESTSGAAKMPYKNLQLKLSFTF